MSGEKIPYHLRQNKHVERELFVDILSHIDRVLPIKQYLYVGFGGPYLEDFRVIHSHFGNPSMLSLEREPWVYQRQKMNVPYGCVECRNFASSEFIESFEEIIEDFSRTSNVLVWLDYAAAAQLRQQVTEVHSLVAKLRPFDVLKITLNANPATLGGDPTRETLDGLRLLRLETLRSRLGDYLSSTVGTGDITADRYPPVLVRALEVASQRALRSSDFLLQPLGIFTYSDSQHQMLTVTCIVLHRNQVTEFLQKSGLRNFEFGSATWDKVVRISVPYLSVREKFYLDQLLYKKTQQRDRSRLKASVSQKLTLGQSPAVTDEMIGQYLRFYRYYPHYHRIQF